MALPRFDHVIDGPNALAKEGMVLLFQDLDTFLGKMGCLKTAEQGDSLPKDVESVIHNPADVYSTLKLVLWKYLDPRGRYFFSVPFVDLGMLLSV